MLSFELRSWSCWAPGIEKPDDWEAWIRGDITPPRTDAPELKTLKPVHRRRLSGMGRATYHCATNASANVTPGTIIYSSAHGEFARTTELLASLATHQPLSPNQFSLSVHNAIAGLLSIHHGWRAPAQCVAAGDEGIGAAFLLASMAIENSTTDDTALVVLVDGHIPPPFESAIANPPPTNIAAALLVSRANPRSRTLTVTREASRRTCLEHWDQIRHLAALLAASSGRLTLETGAASWSWALS